MLKKILPAALLLAVLALSCAALAAEQPIAPDYIPGKITAVVAAQEGTFVYDDFDENLPPVSALPFGAQVEVQTLGLGWCRVKMDDIAPKCYIRTKDLSFSEAPYGNQLAVVFVQRSKSLPMHKTASLKSGNVTKVPDGQYVVIVERGDQFSLALYGKYQGYLQNDYLSFRDAWEMPVAKAILRDPNKPQRRTTVNIRSADRSNGNKLKQYPTLRPLTVLQIKSSGWAEVETEDGLHGYLLNTNKSGGEWLELSPGAFAPMLPDYTPQEMIVRLEAQAEEARLAEEAAQEAAEEEAADDPDGEDGTSENE